jgi:RNA polymerase-binding transcription factor DksA
MSTKYNEYSSENDDQKQIELNKKKKYLNSKKHKMKKLNIIDNDDEYCICIKCDDKIIIESKKN